MTNCSEVISLPDRCPRLTFSGNGTEELPDISPVINEYSCFFIFFVFAALSAVIAKTVSAPVERVKIVIQCLFKDASELGYEKGQNKLLPKTNPQTSFGILDTAKYIYHNEGILAFWRGNLANCIRYVPQFAFDISIKDSLKGQIKGAINPCRSDDFGLHFLASWMAGTTASIMSTVICYPLDFARTKLAADMGKDKDERQFCGILDVWRKTVKAAKNPVFGLFAIYSGLLVTMIGAVFYRGTKYALYDGLEDITKYTLLGCDPNDAAEFFFRWLFGWAVSSVAATIAYPFDTVRRLMMLQADLETKEYKHFIDCFKQLYAEYGILRFFKGNVANIIRGWSSGLALALFSTLTDAARKNPDIDYCWTMYD